MQGRESGRGGEVDLARGALEVDLDRARGHLVVAGVTVVLVVEGRSYLVLFAGCGGHWCCDRGGVGLGERQATSGEFESWKTRDILDLGESIFENRRIDNTQQTDEMNIRSVLYLVQYKTQDRGSFFSPFFRNGRGSTPRSGSG